MQKSKITTIAKTGENTWKDKLLSKHFVQFEDGANGTLTTGFNDDPVPVVGDELEFEIVDKGYGNEVQLPKKAGASGGFKPKAWTPDQIAQEGATKLTCSALQGGAIKAEDWKIFFGEAKAFLISQIEADKLPF